jgi:Asp-tRNA(Asn)/Glu-tRNA(Gln) amidotransferase A subunit family amidase
MPWTGGFGYRHDVVADADAHVVKRLRGQGAVIIGKTSLDEGSFGTSGVNAIYGDCVHPQFPGYSAGGSSSGAAVSVATGMAVYALGTDGMGSARIPAALCGVAGFKPSQGRVSQRGVLPGTRRLDCVGVLGRHVRDLQLPYHAIAGLDRLDAMSRVTPLRHLEPARWRVAHVPVAALPGLSEPVAQVYQRALQRLQHDHATGSVVWTQQVLAGHDFAATRRDGSLLMCAEMAVVHAAALQEPSGSDASSISPWLQRMLQFPARRTAVDLMAADRRIDAVVVYLRQVFEQTDVLLLPTTPVTTHPLAQHAPDNMADYTALASLAGLPALSLPCGRTTEGHPVGLQLIGPVGSDLLLLMLGARWQDALPDEIA